MYVHVLLQHRTINGERHPSGNDWEGTQGAKQGDRIGVLLDLDQGSMTAWKHDAKMGVMQVQGLRGPLCWAVSLRIGRRGDAARIESAPAPAPSTDEELAAA